MDPQTLNYIAVGALLVSMLALWFLWDRQRARYIRHQHFFKLYLWKALSDRNDKVRIPAEQVKEMFELSVRTIPNPDLKPGTQHRHPALRRAK